ncbi:MAG: ArsR/SmtB family transcription factor [Egibacteraceae bacterium]
MEALVDGDAQVFAALGDATRRRLLDLLALHGEATATTLATQMPISRQAVVKHLGTLDRAGLVRGRRRANEVRYSVCPDRLEAAARRMARIASDWESRLAAIKRIAEELTE